MANYSWTCPYCKKATTITKEDFTIFQNDLQINNKIGEVRFESDITVCPNAECKEITYGAYFRFREYKKGLGWVSGKKIKEWRLMPVSDAKIFPDYIPCPLIADYEEAVLIKALSPKASATLSRRCIQGIIRDFWEVKPGRLIDEIKQVEDKVEPLVWESIQSIRQIGNIGAHMENDINLIVDVDPDEAQLLIELIEMLFHEWYVLKKERENRLNKIVSTNQKKQAKRKNHKD